MNKLGSSMDPMLYRQWKIFFKLVVVNAGKLGIPSLCPSTFANNPNEKNDRMALPVRELHTQIKFTVKESDLKEP